jgi:hypothetical protein
LAVLDGAGGAGLAVQTGRGSGDLSMTPHHATRRQAKL